MAQKEHRTHKTRNALIIFLLVVLMIMTIVETALIVHTVRLTRHKPQQELLENSTTTGEVRLVVVNITSGVPKK